MIWQLGTSCCGSAGVLRALMNRSRQFWSSASRGADASLYFPRMSCISWASARSRVGVSGPLCSRSRSRTGSRADRTDWGRRGRFGQSVLFLCIRFRCSGVSLLSPVRWRGSVLSAGRRRCTTGSRESERSAEAAAATTAASSAATSL